MRKASRFSFAVKIATLVIGLTLTIEVVVSVAVGRLLSRTLETEFESKGTTKVRSLSISVEEILTAQERALLQGKLEQYWGAAGA